MKKWISIFAVVGLLTSLSFTTASAGWNYVKVFPNDTLSYNTGLNNCFAVDPDGKIWIVPYASANDSVMVNGAYVGAFHITVFNPDGSVSKTYGPVVTYNGTTDTLFSGAGYGGTTDHDGNVILLKTSSWIRKFNYKTGVEMAQKHFPIPGYASSMTSPMTDNDNEVFITSVVPTTNVGPVALSADFSSIAATVDTGMGGQFSRNVSVSGNGNDVYVHLIAHGSFYYHSDAGTLGIYTFVDTLWKDLVIESSAWRPGTKELWVSAGNAVSGLPNPPYSGYAWYGFDMTNPASPVLKDSIIWNGGNGISGDSIANDPRPRGIQFSPDGATAYIAAFGPSKGFMQVFQHVTAVRRDPTAVAENYSLSQNYPNPFNPSTEINFSIANNATVSLKVYDVLGKEVATLVEGARNAGVYHVNFDASNISAGVYYYTLRTSDGFVQTKKMLLLK